MRYLLAILSAALFVGCDFRGWESPNHFHDWIPGDTTAERQMEIQRVLESNGWTNVGFYSTDGVICVSADRKL